MNSTPKPVSAARLSAPALSLLVGLLLAYGFSDLNVGYPFLNRVLAGVTLLACCGLTSWKLCQGYVGVPMTYWGSGCALLLSILPVYVAIKSDDVICHLSTAKIVILSLGFAGSCLLVFGFIQSLEARSPLEQTTSLDGVARGGRSPEEITHVCLLLVLLIALFVLEQKFVAECWW